MFVFVPLVHFFHILFSSRPFSNISRHLTMSASSKSSDSLHITIPWPKDHVPQTHLYLHLYINSKTKVMELGIYSKAMPAINSIDESYTLLMDAQGHTFEEAKKKLLHQWDELQKRLHHSQELHVKWQAP